MDLPMTDTRVLIWQTILRVTGGGREPYEGHISEEPELRGISPNTVHSCLVHFKQRYKIIDSTTTRARRQTAAGSVRARRIRVLVDPADVTIVDAKYGRRNGERNQHSEWGGDNRFDFDHAAWRKAVAGRNVRFEDAPLVRKIVPRQHLAVLQRATYGGAGRW